VALDEYVEVHRIKVSARGVREPGDVPWRDRRARPFHVATSSVFASRVTPSARDLSELPEAFAG